MKKTVRRVRKAPAKKKTVRRVRKAPAKKKVTPKKKTVRRVRKAPAKKIPKKGGKYSGVIYAITHPKWQGWVKLGMSIITGKSIETRYNTSYPDRGCKLIEEVWVSSRLKAEKELHNLAEEKSSKRDHEWFKISQKEAIKLMKKVGNKF